MAKGWHRTTRGRPCEICGHGNGWCSYNDDGLQCCMRTGGEPVAGWDLISAKTNAHGHLAGYYWPKGEPRPDRGAWKPDPEKEAARKAEEERQREKAAGWARRIWGQCCTQDPKGNHPVTRAYLAGRGIPLDRLPGGAVPRTLRYHPALVRDEVVRVEKYRDPDTNRERKKTIYREPKPMYPAIVGRGTWARGGAEKNGTMGAVRCVQRIYLEVTGAHAGKIPHGEAKKCQGPTGGAAVRLSAPDQAGGVLVLCEGLETGVALLAAMKRPDGTHPTVWACISTSGLFTADVSDCLGWVKHIIIAADHDHVDPKIGERPGIFFARMGRNALLKNLAAAGWAGTVAIADPDHQVAPEMVREDGWVLLGQSFGEKDEAIEGKSVDWLDIVATMGPERAGKLVMEAAGRDVMSVGGVGGGGGGAGGAAGADTPHAPHSTPHTPSGGGGDGWGAGGGGGGGAGGGGRRVVQMGRHSIARALLEEGFGGMNGVGPGECWPLRYYAGKWWKWVAPARGAPRYVEANPAWLEAEATRTMDEFLQENARGKIHPMAPKPADVNAALAASVYYTAVPDGSMPAWIGEEFDDQGRPTWESSLAWGDERATGPIPVQSCVAFKNGLLDVDRWVQGHVELVPPTPRWFSRSCLPFELPVERLREVERQQVDLASDEPVQAMLRELCPTWMKFLEAVSAGETEGERAKWISTLRRWFGYCLTPDISLERVLMIQGAPGTGKGTISEAMMGVVGENNVLATTLDKIAGRFDLAAMVGVSLVVVPELRVGGHTDIASALDTLNSISGGDPQSFEEKYGKRQAFVRMSAKFVLTPNETPKLPDPSNALVRRLVVLKMAPPPAKRDPELKKAIKREGLGIMLWALYGLRELRIDLDLGAEPFELPAGSAAVLDDVRRSASPVLAFVEDCCVRRAEASVGTAELYEAWKAYAEAEGHQDRSAITFGRQLNAAVSELRKDKGGGRAARYVGLGLRLDWHDSVKTSTTGPSEHEAFGQPELPM